MRQPSEEDQQPTGRALLDRVTFDDFARLFDADELGEMLEQWHADSVAAFDAMTAALTADDLARVGEIAHRSMGGALALGAVGLAAACEELRQAAEGGRAVAETDVARLRAVVEASYVAMSGDGGAPGAGGQKTT